MYEEHSGTLAADVWCDPRSRYKDNLLLSQICVDFYRSGKCKISQEKHWLETQRQKNRQRERNKARGNNTAIGQNYLLLPSALFLIRVKPTSLKPSMCKSQLDKDRSFLQGEWTKLQKHWELWLTPEVRWPLLDVVYQIYLYRHTMGPFKDPTVCEWVGWWVGGWVLVCHGRRQVLSQLPN